MKIKKALLTGVSVLCVLAVSGCGNLTGGTSPSGNQTQPGVQVVETPRESSSAAESSAESSSLPASSTPIEPSGTAASSKPAEVSGAGESSLSESITRRVPNVVGLTQSSAETIMMNVGFRVNVTTQYSDTVAAGKVISQSPSTGSAETGSVVNLVVSKGKKPGESSKPVESSKPEESAKTVPNVVGAAKATAETTIKNAGFQVSVTEVYSDTVASGKVISQTPSGGNTAAKNAVVTLTISKGKKPQEPSKPDTKEVEKQALTNYIKRIEKQGTITQGFDDPNYSGFWKVNQYKIDDFNKDGSYELVIQYYCGVSRKSSGSVISPRQGVKLKIVKYIDGRIKEFYVTDDFSRYVRTAGADVSSNSEITEELYIDKSGRLGILTSKAISSSRTGLAYQLMVLKNNSLQWADGFGFSEFYQMGRYGMDNSYLKENHYYCEFSADNTYDSLYSFYVVKNIFPTGATEPQAMDLFDYSKAFVSIDSLNKVSAFAITSESDPLNTRKRYESKFRSPGDYFYCP